MKFALCVCVVLMLSGCAGSDQRYHDYQNQRLSECKHKIDDDYFECIENNKDNYEDRFEEASTES